MPRTTTPRSSSIPTAYASRSRTFDRSAAGGRSIGIRVEDLVRRREGKAERFGHAAVGDPAVVDVDRSGEWRILARGLFETLIGDRQRIGKGRVGERIGGGVRHDARHVR